MCYSAQVWAAFDKFVRVHGAGVDIREFVKLYGFRAQAGATAVKIPKGMDAPFLRPRTDAEREIKAMIDAFNTEQAAKLELELFKQRKRLADAERTLQTKTTKKAQDDQRIATEKVSWIMSRLGDLRRTEPLPRDSRIFPGHYAPVMVMEDGKRMVRPMRYQCRPHGKPEFYDRKFPGTYNARRDNLEGFWRDLFGYSHGLIVAERFFENVERVDEHGKAYNAVLEFKPQDGRDMLVACLWSRWRGPDGAELLSFAAITDEPPQEVAAAGHDRCIVPIRAEHIDAWLAPDRRNLAAQYAILDDRETPYYEHRLAA